VLYGDLLCGLIDLDYLPAIKGEVQTACENNSLVLLPL
jgi:hypothetical protein